MQEWDSGTNPQDQILCIGNAFISFDFSICIVLFIRMGGRTTWHVCWVSLIYSIMRKKPYFCLLGTMHVLLITCLFVNIGVCVYICDVH